MKNNSNIEKQFKFDNSRFAYDYRIVTTDSKKILVEYDGAQHYTSPSVIMRDKKKDELAGKNGHSLIRWPYWLQPTAEVINYLFDINISTNFDDYPQGFIDKKCILPAEFCSLGVNRLEQELDAVAQEIPETYLQIKKSIADKVAELGKQLVIPEFISSSFLTTPTLPEELSDEDALDFMKEYIREILKKDGKENFSLDDVYSGIQDSFWEFYDFDDVPVLTKENTKMLLEARGYEERDGKFFFKE